MAYEGDAKSLLTLSSKSEGSSALTKAKWRNASLHERCSIYDMVRVKTAFQEAYENKFLKNEFRNLLRTLLNLEYDDDDFNILFMKINTNRNGEVTWDELVSHLLLGFFADDPENQRETMQLPIMGLPTVMRSQHRHPISRIIFSPEVSKFRTTDPMQGIYLTASRDGMINWWSLDMTYLRTAFSSSPHLKVRTTWVTDMVCMPDINIVVTSSTERDLRFYDCTAKTFTLKIIITSWEYMICTMHYHFEEDINQECMLILGDVGGNVRLLRFSPVGRGPFKNEAGRALIQLRKVDLAKQLPELRLVDIGRMHSDWVRQTSYYSSLNCVVSCATCAQSLLMCDFARTTHNMFSTDKGIQCFAFDERAHVLVTGGPDCEVRVWNPFLPARATLVLGGHHAAVIAIVLQNHGQTIYSMARDRAIKVWDVQAQVCVQTYIDIPASLGTRTPISAAYNQGTRELVLAGAMIARITLDEALGARHTDGMTHSRAITAVLYNPLFKVLVTCGMDSIIVNWDPITGKRNVMIRDAHTRLLRGELIPVEITSACFDPGHQLLLTGARDGTLKVWNFNTGVNLRCMSIEHMCEVTSVFWIEGRILAVGWNRHVTEFEDSGTSSTGKAWDTRHRDDVLAAACHSPYSLATASYNSELVLWKLDTGQPYRMFSCSDPMLRIKLKYSKRDARTTTTVAVARRQSTISIPRPSSVGLESSDAIRKARARRASSVHLAQQDNRAQPRPLAAHATLYLQTRPCCMHTASLMVSLENGMVQGWSDHPAGGYKGAFQGVHTLGDYVSAMATDEKNEYLFTGTTVGYIKVFLMTNYLVNEEVHVNMSRIRLEFPFLLRDRIEGRAKRSVRDQPLPMLLNSYRGHMRCVTTMAYIDELKILLTGSSDYSVRVWRLSGEYLQTLGGLVPYTLLESRMPPDVLKVASFTTLKVWRNGYVSRYVPGQVQVDALRDITERELQTKTFGEPAPEPLLGNYFTLPSRPDRQDPIKLDDSLPTIPLYCQLRLARSQPVRRPPTPPRVAATRLRNDDTRRGGARR